MTNPHHLDWCGDRDCGNPSHRSKDFDVLVDTDPLALRDEADRLLREVKRLREVLQRIAASGAYPEAAMAGAALRGGGAAPNE